MALDRLGGWLGERVIVTTPVGYRDLVRWAESLSAVRCFGVEGTGRCRAGLARGLRDAAHTVLEVDRPARSARRRLGKSDPIDAELAARQVLSGTAATLPKHADGIVEALRLLTLTKRSADKARTAALIQLRSVLVTAPADIREDLRGLGPTALVERCASFRPGTGPDPRPCRDGSHPEPRACPDPRPCRRGSHPERRACPDPRPCRHGSHPEPPACPDPRPCRHGSHPEPRACPDPRPCRHGSHPERHACPDPRPCRHGPVEARPPPPRLCATMCDHCSP